jgi:hypothetical protein
MTLSAVPQDAGAMPAERPRDELSHIRSQAKKHGLSIRTRRSARVSGVDRFSLLDKATGAVLTSDIIGLEELRNEIWWTVRKRALASGELGPSQAPERTCPTCGTPRVGFLRLCRACGLEFEATDTESRIALAIRSTGSSNDASVTTNDAPRPGAVLKIARSQTDNRLWLVLAVLGLVLAAALIGALVPLILWAIQG